MKGRVVIVPNLAEFRRTLADTDFLTGEDLEQMALTALDYSAMSYSHIPRAEGTDHTFRALTQVIIGRGAFPKVGLALDEEYAMQTNI